MRRLGLPKLLLLGAVAVVALVLTGGARAAQLDYVEATSPLTVTATTQAAGQTFLTSNSVSADGSTRMRFEFYAPLTEGGVNGRTILSLWDGSTCLGIISFSYNPGGSAHDYPAVTATRYLTPSAGSHTYTVRAHRENSNGAIYAGSGSGGDFMPAYLRISDEPTGGGGASALDDLTDVTITSPIDGAVIKYDEDDSQWKVATDDAGGEGSSGPVTLSASDRERLDLSWWGVWAIVGLLLCLIIAPPFMGVMRVTRGMGS